MALLATTEIGDGAAIVRNTWTERRWSAFLGTGIELTHLVAARSWFEAENTEVVVELDGKSVDHMAFGAVEWSEERNPHGTVLVAERHGIAPDLTVSTMLFNENPGMIRRSFYLNAGDVPVQIAYPTLDRLPIRPCTVRVNDFGELRESFSGPLTERALAVEDETSGLILGIHGGGMATCFEAGAAECRLWLDESRTLEPGETWLLPDCFVLPYRGDIREFSGQGLGTFLQQWQAFRKWEAECALELAEDDA